MVVGGDCHHGRGAKLVTMSWCAWEEAAYQVTSSFGPSLAEAAYQVTSSFGPSLTEAAHQATSSFGPSLTYGPDAGHCA